jgi:hypothetical protein
MHEFRPVARSEIKNIIRRTTEKKTNGEFR